MKLGDEQHSHLNQDRDEKINLSRPSESLIQKSQAGYTSELGVIKPLSFGPIELLNNSKVRPLFETPNPLVIPCADGTALKPTILLNLTHALL